MPSASAHPEVMTLDALAGRVRPGSRIGVSGHHFARLPIALLREVISQGATDLRYFSWAGGLPLEMLIEAGAVTSADICFSSLDIFGLPPLFRAAVEAGALPVTDWPALSMIGALRAAQQNLPFMPVQLPEGSDMAARCPSLREHQNVGTGRTIGLVAAQPLDTLLLHVPFADRSGNLAIIGARALDLAMIGAATEVLVTADRIVEDGSLQAMGRQSIVTRNLVTAIAEVPGAAWPTSSLPHYVTDYAHLNGLLGAAGAGRSLHDGLAMPGTGVPARLSRPAGLPAPSVRAEAFRPGTPVTGPATVDEVMAVRLARMLDSDCVASAGAVSPLANVAYRLAKATHAPGLMIMTFSCGHLDIGPGPLTLSLIEVMDADSAVGHAGGDDTYSTYYQAGLITHEVIAAAQIDGAARVNNLALVKPSGGPLRLAGQGGMSDVANMHRDSILYVTRHSPRSLVERVATISSARGLIDPESRRAAGYQPGAVQVLTDLCLFTLDPAIGCLAVTEMLPGVTGDRIESETGFAVTFSPDCAEMPEPEPEILAVLRRDIDPLGLRRLEFVSARDRAALLDEIISRDAAGVDRCLAGRAAAA